MKSLVKAEMKKLTSVRSMWGLLLLAPALAVFAVVAPGENVVAGLAKPLRDQQYVVILGLVIRLLAFVLGVRIITDEFRYRTIGQSLLGQPRRHRVVFAKLGIGLVAALAMAALAEIAMLVTAAAVGRANGVHLALGASDVLTLGGLAAGTAAWTVIGLAVGAIARSQSLALVVGLVWLMGVEDLLAARLGPLGERLPGAEALNLLGSVSGGASLTSLAVLAGYGAAASLWAVASMQRRDMA